MNISVQKNGNGLSVFAGNGTQAANSNGNHKVQSGQQENGKSVFAGNIFTGNMMPDPIEQKRQQARELAMRAIGDTFADEKELDASIEEQKQIVDELKEERLQTGQQLKDVKAAKEMYIAEYGLDEEGVEMTPEQQAEMLEFEKAETELSNRITSMGEEAKARNMAVENIMVERLKSHPMVDAQEEADEIMEAASKEIVGMLIDEAKDHVDKTMEEQKEKAEEAKEEKEEQEEKIKEKTETPAQQKLSNTAETMGELQDINQDHKMLQQELKVMVDTKEILEEDLKGLLVDQQL